VADDDWGSESGKNDWGRANSNNDWGKTTIVVDENDDWDQGWEATFATALNDITVILHESFEIP
jgi:hypothetical protein